MPLKVLGHFSSQKVLVGTEILLVYLTMLLLIRICYTLMLLTRHALVILHSILLVVYLDSLQVADVVEVSL